MGAPSVRPHSAGRLFLGVALTDQARCAVRLHLAPEALPRRVVSPEDWHLTLRFLGETAYEPFEGLREALGTADLGPRFDVVLGRLGTFPGPDRAVVLWLGVDEGTGALAALAARVESVARRTGFPSETRAFAPHVTLSRLRPPADVSRLVERVPALQERMAVDAVVLFRSGRGGGSGCYEEVERYPLPSIRR